MKKTLVFSLLVSITAVFSLPAAASCFCRLPNAPKIPDGATAEASEMEFSKNEIASYQRNVESYKQCLNQCIVDADTSTGDVIRQWNATVESYNSRLGTLAPQP